MHYFCDDLSARPVSANRVQLIYHYDTKSFTFMSSKGFNKYRGKKFKKI